MFLVKYTSMYLNLGSSVEFSDYLELHAARRLHGESPPLACPSSLPSPGSPLLPSGLLPTLSESPCPLGEHLTPRVQPLPIPFRHTHLLAACAVCLGRQTWGRCSYMPWKWAWG